MAPVRTKRIALVSTRIPNYPHRKKAGGGGSAAAASGPQVHDVVFDTPAVITEGAAPGTPVTTVSSLPPGAELTLVNDAGGRFALEGAVLVAGPTPTDYETATQHTVVIRGTLGASTLDKPLVVSVQDVVELTDFTLTGAVVAEDAALGAQIGVLSSDPVGAAFTLTDSAGGRFALDGVNLVRGATALDYEAASSHDITVRAELGGEVLNKTFTIQVSDIAELTSVALSAARIAENSPAGTAVGVLSSIPAGASFTLVNTAGNRFALAGGDQIVAGAVATDYEAATSHSITVRATRLGETLDQSFTISVDNVNELTGVTLTGSTVAENTGPGVTVGVLASTPAGATFALTNDAGGRFAVSGANLVTGAVSTNYEAATSHDVTVEATRGADVITRTFTITVTDVAEDLAFDLSPASISEGAAPGTLVGTLSSTPAGATYVLSDNAGNRFALTGGDQIVAGAVATDFEAAASHVITVDADLDGLTASLNLTITVADVAELTDIALSNTTVAENIAQNAVVGALTSTPGGATWTLVNSAGNRFALSGANVVRGATALDYEAATSHEITVRGTRGGETLEKTLTITVTDVVEISDITLTGNTTPEDSAQGDLVGALTSTPAGAAFVMTNNAGNRFALSGSNVVRGAAALDYANASSHDVTIRGTRLGETRDKTFTINVTAVVPVQPEASRPAQSDIMVSQEYIYSGAAEGAILGSLMVIPKTTEEYAAFTSGVTYTLSDDAGGRFKLSTGSSYSRQLQAGPTATDVATAEDHAITVRAEWGEGAYTREQTIVMTVRPAGSMRGGTNQTLAAGTANPTATATGSSGTAPYTHEWALEESSGFVIASGAASDVVTLNYTGATPGYGWAVARAVTYDSAGKHAWSRFLAIYAPS